MTAKILKRLIKQELTKIENQDRKLKALSDACVGNVQELKQALDNGFQCKLTRTEVFSLMNEERDFYRNIGEAIISKVEEIDEDNGYKIPLQKGGPDIWIDTGDGRIHAAWNASTHSEALPGSIVEDIELCIEHEKKAQNFLIM